MQKSETGRSILEILSVLVIMILIVWGGLRLWNEASFDAQGHALGERLFAIRDSRRLSMNTHSNKKMLRTEVGPHSSKITIENGIGPQNKDWFWISVNIANSSLCSFLTEYDIDAGFVNDDCETSNEVTFYFLKFPENASSDTPNKDNQPKECPENMICNDNFEPIGCKENYFLHNGNCTQCPENNSICENGTFECKDGYYKDGIRCRSCGANVLSCDEDGNPTECKVNYYLSGNLCIACPTTGLATCDDDGFTCQAGYYKNRNSCTSCGTGVASCDEEGNPTECKSDHYLSGNSCIQCPTTGVASCTSNGFTCQAGYYKNGNTCVFCAQFDQYSIGGSVTACSVCEIGKKANDQHSACVNCQVGEKCACDAGLLWNGTACACPENSSTNVVEGNQIANTVCYCNEGYELNEDKTGCFLDMCQNFTPSTCILSCQTKDGVQEYEYATSGTSCKTNSSFGTDNGFCDGQGNCQPNLCETGCSYNYDCNSGEYCSFDPEDYVSNAPQMCSGQCKAVECTEVVNNNAIKTDITYDSAYNFCSALKRNGIVSDYWGYTPAGYTYWFNNGNMGPLSSSQYTGIQIAVSGGGLASSNAVAYDVRDKKYSVNCPMEMDCPTRVCPENSSKTIREGYQIGTTGCYCNQGYELNGDKTGCIEVIPCPEGSSELLDGQTADGHSTTNVEGCYCNEDTPYWDPESKICSYYANCSAIMQDSGLRTGLWSVSGETITWNPNNYTSSTNINMTPSKDLNLQGCNLIINGRLMNSYAINVDSLTINGLCANTGCYSENSGTLNILNDFRMNDNDSGGNVFLRDDGGLNVKGNVYLNTESRSWLTNPDIGGSIFSESLLLLDGGYIRGDISSAGLSMEGSTVDGNVETLSEEFSGFSGYGIIHGYLKAESTNIKNTGSSEDGIWVSGGDLIVDGDIIGTASQSDSISDTYAVNHTGITLRGYTLKSVSGDIIATGHTGIRADASSTIIAEQGSVIATGKKAYGIDLAKSSMQVRKSVTARTTKSYGLYLAGSNLEAGEGVYASSSNGAALSLGDYNSVSSVLISCGNVWGEGGINGVAIGPRSSIQVKGTLSGSAPAQSTANFRKQNSIFVNSSSNIENIKARQLYNAGDAGSSSYWYNFELHYYPSDYSYTPEWCTQMGY